LHVHTKFVNLIFHIEFVCENLCVVQITHTRTRTYHTRSGHTDWAGDQHSYTLASALNLCTYTYIYVVHIQF